MTIRYVLVSCLFCISFHGDFTFAPAVPSIKGVLSYQNSVIVCQQSRMIILKSTETFDFGLQLNLPSVNKTSEISF